MKQYIYRKNLTQIFALSLGIFLICGSPSYAEETRGFCPSKFPTSKCFSSWTHILPQLASSNVIYLGETHDSELDHQNQLKIIQELYKRNPKIAIALEMFQRPYQGVVDEYLAGKITEEELVKKSEYEKRWGFPWKLYAPILRFARKNKLPVLATNTPAEVSRKVARQGLESLTADERQWIPPFFEIRTDNEDYRKMVLAAFAEHQAAGHGKSADAERFFLVQVLWDETIAESIAKFVQANPNHQVVVLAGQGHIIYGFGIPSRVERRLQGKVTQSTVLLSPSEEIAVLKDRPVANFIFEVKK
jgi:uncharacterized iron-regulated protein